MSMLSSLAETTCVQAEELVEALLRSLKLEQEEKEEGEEEQLGKAMFGHLNFHFYSRMSLWALSGLCL
jgi:hypothetical protein